MKRSFVLPPLVCCWLGCFLLLSAKAAAQSGAFPYTPVPLQDLQAFKPVTGNWQLAGDVFFDPVKGGAAKTTAGTGVLVNSPAKGRNGHLFTLLEHGDLELELEFMMAKGSNSGVYLQGRYEVQLFDSWGQSQPTYADAGGIYQRWDAGRGAGREGYEGHAPLVNVSRAPGLWQHYRIKFRAPRFNAQGQKTENARFEEVYHNGVLVQRNVEVTGPTRSAAFTDEKPAGPLMVQGDHGPVAIRNIRYKAYGVAVPALSDLKLSAYNGRFTALPDFNTLRASAQMAIEALAHPAPAGKEGYAGKISGMLEVPAAGRYLLELHLGWMPQQQDPAFPNGGELRIAGRKVLSLDGTTGGKATAMVELAAGRQPLVLSYFKTNGSRNNGMRLTLEAPGVAATTFSTPPARSFTPTGAIRIRAEGKPVLQRGFVNHQGRKRTHVLSVGEPEKANYAVDLNTGELLQVWRGDFLEATPMWAGRGETQLSVPQGSVLEFPARPALTFLADQAAAWPDSNAAYTYQGYDVSKAGRPILKYTLGTASVRETFEPQDGGRKLSHSLTVMPGQETQQLWCLVAEGSRISRLPNGLYAVNDKQYFIELAGKEKPLIRTTSRNTQELLLPVRAKDKVATVTYAIVW